MTSIDFKSISLLLFLLALPAFTTGCGNSTPSTVQTDSKMEKLGPKAPVLPKPPQQ